MLRCFYFLNHLLWYHCYVSPSNFYWPQIISNSPAPVISNTVSVSSSFLELDPGLTMVAALVVPLGTRLPDADFGISGFPECVSGMPSRKFSRKAFVGSLSKAGALAWSPSDWTSSNEVRKKKQEERSRDFSDHFIVQCIGVVVHF